MEEEIAAALTNEKNYQFLAVFQEGREGKIKERNGSAKRIIMHVFYMRKESNAQVVNRALGKCMIKKT